MKELIKKEYIESKGEIKLKVLAEKYNVSEGTIRSWKSRDEWDKDVEKALQRSCNKISKNVATKWDDLKRDFMCNDYKDLREFAEKHNIKYGNGGFIRKTTGWISEKKELRREVNEKVIDITEKQITDELAKLNRRHIDISTKIMNKAEEAIGELNKYVTWVSGEGLQNKEINVLDVEKLLKITKALSDVQKIQRLAVGDGTGEDENINITITRKQKKDG